MASVAVYSATPEFAFAETVTEPENASCGNPSARDAIAKIESEGSGGYKAVSKDGFLGRYQIGEAKLVDLGYAAKDGNSYDNRITWTAKARSRWGISSNSDFLNNDAAQESIYTEINALNEKYLGSAMNAVGDSLPCGGSVTKAALLAGSQLGAGKVQAYINNGYKCVPGKKTATNDGNGTCVEKFMCAVSGCNHIEKDMSKKTCEVTMPMIEAIDCSNYSGSIVGFCNKYKPFLMTRAECDDAESMAEAAEKGPQEEQCENQSFGPGSGSWSYVLACSYAGEFEADQDGMSTISSFVSDPECMNKLKGMGVDFNQLGQVQNGSYGGTTCIIENAVSMKGTPYMQWGANLTLSCDAALAMVQFDQKMQGIGASSYYGIGSTRTCGPKRDKNGNKPGTITEHSLGRAIDVSGFVVGGQKISFGALHKPLSPEGVLAVQAKNFACSTFRLVLSPKYGGYSGAYVHFHLEQAGMSGCK